MTFHRIILMLRQASQRPAISEVNCETICRVRRGDLRDRVRALPEARRKLVAIEPEDENFAIGMKAASCGCLLIFDRIGRQDARMLCHVAASCEAVADEIAFVVHIGVDVVGKLAVALIALKPHVVRGRSHP